MNSSEKLFSRKKLGGRPRIEIDESQLRYLYSKYVDGDPSITKKSIANSLKISVSLLNRILAQKAKEENESINESKM